LGIHRRTPTGVWVSTAAIVVEVVSPGDETEEKPPFYVAHGVNEIVIVDPLKRAVSWLALGAGEYQLTEASALMELGAVALERQIARPEMKQD
jgi:Uma2 family endonuclease